MSENDPYEPPAPLPSYEPRRRGKVRVDGRPGHRAAKKAKGRAREKAARKSRKANRR